MTDGSLSPNTEKMAEGECINAENVPLLASCLPSILLESSFLHTSVPTLCLPGICELCTETKAVSALSLRCYLPGDAAGF